MADIIKLKRKTFKKEIGERPKAIPLGLRLAAVWGVYVIILVAVFVWLPMENRRMAELYNQSKLCDSRTPMKNQENCREELAATVHEVSYVFGGPGISRYGGRSSSSSVDALNVNLILPDGKIALVQIGRYDVFRVQRNKDVAPDFNVGPIPVDPFEIESFQIGEILTVERWHGKVTAVRVTKGSDILTADHPSNYPKRVEIARSIAGLVLIALLFWSGIELIRKRK